MEQNTEEYKYKLRRFVADLVKGLDRDRDKESKGYLVEGIEPGRKEYFPNLISEHITEWTAVYEKEAFERGYMLGEKDATEGKQREPKEKAAERNKARARSKLRPFIDELVVDLQQKGWVKEKLSENLNRGIRLFLSRRVNDWTEEVEASAFARGYYSANPRKDGAGSSYKKILDAKSSDLKNMPEIKRLAEVLEKELFDKILKRVLSEVEKKLSSNKSSAARKKRS